MSFHLFFAAAKRQRRLKPETQEKRFEFCQRTFAFIVISAYYLFLLLI